MQRSLYRYSKPDGVARCTPCVDSSRNEAHRSHTKTAGPAPLASWGGLALPVSTARKTEDARDIRAASTGKQPAGQASRDEGQAKAQGVMEAAAAAAAPAAGQAVTVDFFWVVSSIASEASLWGREGGSV